MRPWRTILCPVDLSASCARVIDAAATLARRERAKLVLLHASELPAGLGASVRVALEGGAFTSAESFARQAATESLEALARPLRAEGTEVQTLFALGSPVASICKAVRELDADLIVMGTHAREGLSHALLGSVAERVLRLATVPVLTIRQLGDDVAHTAAEDALSAERDG